MTDDAAALIEALRVRLRRDPGDELFIDGKATKVTWPGSFLRMAPGIFAEIVLDSPSMIQSFPMERWTATPEELLEAAWKRTLNRTQFTIGEVDVGLEEPILVVEGEPPYVTAFALNPCAVFRESEAGPLPFAALVAIPTPDYFFLHCFKHEAMEEKDTIATRMADIAEQQWNGADEKKRISPHVFLSMRSKGISLERV